jgi:hypothetical protein
MRLRASSRCAMATIALRNSLGWNCHLQLLRLGSSSAKFAPADGPAFFARYGWNPIEVQSVLKTAAGLKRLMARPTAKNWFWPAAETRSLPSAPTAPTTVARSQKA